MKIKILEIRDSGTRIDVMAIKMSHETSIQRHYLWTSGYPEDGSGVGLVRLSDWKATNDLYDWTYLGMGQRTMQYAHDYITKNFDELNEGDVVDVEFILKETTHAKLPERVQNI